AGFRSAWQSRLLEQGAFRRHFQMFLRYSWRLAARRATRDPDGKFNIIGATCLSSNQPPISTNPGARNILLMHYPAWVEKLGTSQFDLILSGHSHGGQVRIPFYGPIFVPFGVGRYVMGSFRTPAGPLYVN